MSGIQISGLLSNSSFDWKSVVDQLIQADGIPLRTLNKNKTDNTAKVDALAAIQTSLTDLQDSLQNLRAGDIFSARTVSSDTAGSTWRSSSVKGAAVGSYTVAVQTLATKARTDGAANVGSGLASTSTVSGLTVAGLNTAIPVSAGTFTVNGAQVTIAITDSLQDVFDRIATATGNNVTSAYDPTDDAVTLGAASGPVVLGAANDTSNFLQVLKLSNNGTGSTTSVAALGTLRPSSPLASGGFRTALAGLDGSSNGSFKLNGVAVSFNANTDTLNSLINRVNQAGAGVTLAYDSANDRVTLTNNSTGDIGQGLADTTGNLLSALGLTNGAGGSLARGKDAQFRINGGPLLTSRSNTLDAAAHGILGLSVTVNSETTQTLQVESDTASMQSAIQDVVDKFNAVQTLIENDTKITISGGSVTTSVLSDNHEVQAWAGKLQAMAFDPVTGATGAFKRLDDLGLDFNGTTGQLAIKDSAKLLNALSGTPDDVQKFFVNGSAGFVPAMYGYLTNVKSSDSSMKSNLSKQNTDLDTQIATLQARLDNERATLTTSFIAMLDAQSKAQSQQTYLTNTFFKSSSSG